MFSKHTRIVKHLPVLPVLWPLPVRREGQFAPGVGKTPLLQELERLREPGTVR